MATLTHYPPVTLPSPHSVHSRSTHDHAPHDQTAHDRDMEPSDDEEGDTAPHVHSPQLQLTHDQTHAPALAHAHAPTPAPAPAPALPPLPAPLSALASDHMDSDMEGGEDTAGGVSPSPWTQNMNGDTASVRVVDLHDVPGTPAPPPFTPLSPIPPPPPPMPPQLDAPEHAIHHPPPPPVHLNRSTADDRDEDDEDDDDDDDRSHVSYDRARNFYPFEQDLSVPDPEELRIMQSYTENSAMDDAHWREKTFFDPQDPDLVSGEHGMIEWVVDEFNGTKENPRKDLLLRSPTVQIGGYEWRIKLLPHGNMHTDRLSLYIENVTVQSLPQEEWPEDQLPLPAVGGTKVMKRKAVSAQVSILVYNPDEPRVNEFKSDAHQFHQASSDHGWSRFSNIPWYEIHRRSYAQRQPLLRNDTLAIKAYIRIIHDPTGCMWALNESERLRESSSMTGLSAFPSFDGFAHGPVLALWLHLRPFREALYLLESADLSHVSSVDDQSDSILSLLQVVLYRMRSRRSAGQTSTELINEYLECIYAVKRSYDIIQTMDDILSEMNGELQRLAQDEGPLSTSARAAQGRLREVFGDQDNQFSGVRQTMRSIQGKSSMQEVVDGLPESMCQSELLTVELERQIFDTEKRCWKKLLNKVRLDDQIVIGRVSYTLYAFAAHQGHLQNGRYSGSFRPAGPRGLWYTYKHSYASCQTRSKAVLPKEGVTPPESLEEPLSMHDHSLHYDRVLGRADNVAYVVIYVRNDVAQSVFDLSVKEPWNVPQWILDDHEPKMASHIQLQASGGASSQAMPYDDNSSRAAAVAANGDLEMDDAVTDVSNGSKASTGDPTDSSRHVTIKYLSQPFYEGQIKDDEYHGEGHLIYLDGNEYTGSLVDGCREGRGTMIYQNGDEYHGDWKSDQHHGQGTYKEKRTGNVYEGHWEEGKKHGQGTTFWKVSEDESRMCRICYCGEADAAFYDCGHVVACSNCARRVEDCPVCRRRVRDVVRLYYLA